MTRARELLGYFESRGDEAVDLLRRLVAIDSPTSDKAGVDRAGALIATELRASGAAVEIHPQDAAGDVVRAVFGSSGAGCSGSGPGALSRGAPAAMLLGHLDTVWPPGEAARRPFRIEGGWAYGPGVYDMKAGIVLCALLARAVGEGVVRPSLPVVCLFSGDEETGSPVSRPRIEAEARAARYVLGLEPSNPDGGAKTMRKGVGRIVVEVIGLAAHAGIDPGKGVNAIEELAAQVLAVKLLARPETGTTVHAGLIEGGVAKNVVAPRARAEFDVRVPSPGEWARLETAALNLRPRNPKAHLRIEAALTHPPMVRTAAIAALYERARRVARDVGFDLGEGSTGGGSDGSHCAALGVPVLDGLGVEGEGAHAESERVRIDRIPPRAAFLAGIMEEPDARPAQGP
ncbi:MAG TPA: M20 family metallopeptidase [Candidatus Polarisedimenticolia bacterium]|nr:M20 family metallopeptidase [Candidatus Polarisedimenticolia bacterium]